MKKKVKLNKNGKVLAFLLSLIGIFLVVVGVFGYLNRPVSNKPTEVIFEVGDGESYSSISSGLKEKDLIRSEFGYKIYLKMNQPKNSLFKGEFVLRKNMTYKEIIKTLSGEVTNSNLFTLTIKEGSNVRKIIKLIASKTDYSEDDIKKVFEDQEFIKELSNKYWFITEDNLNGDLIYSLEGYLYPNTYEFDKRSTVKEIIEKILEETDKKLEPFKEKIESTNWSVHKVLTLASIVELEAISEEDRRMVAGLFFNRLSNNMPLGSDVTTYYAAGIDMGERDLYQTELDAANGYNTRSYSLAGSLPIGPICNPSTTSIDSVLNPTYNDYLFFVADKNGKLYFAKTNEEHNTIIQDLKDKNLWHVYE